MGNALPGYFDHSRVKITTPQLSIYDSDIYYTKSFLGQQSQVPGLLYSCASSWIRSPNRRCMRPIPGDGSLSPCIGAQRKRAPHTFESSCPFGTMPASAKRHQPSFPQRWRPLRLVQRERREETDELWRRLDDLLADASDFPSLRELCALKAPPPLLRLTLRP